MNEELCPGLLMYGVFWAVLSAFAVVNSINERAEGRAWRWTALFGISSLTAAYCFEWLV
jgi:hypothetical protein